MVGMIHRLKEDINECMFTKFGGKIDLDELEEAVLRRLVAEMKSSRKDIIMAYEKQISAMQVVINCKPLKHFTLNSKATVVSLHAYCSTVSPQITCIKVIKIF
jgi:hypothetical protein